MINKNSTKQMYGSHGWYYMHVLCNFQIALLRPLILTLDRLMSKFYHISLYHCYVIHQVQGSCGCPLTNLVYLPSKNMTLIFNLLNYVSF